MSTEAKRNAYALVARLIEKHMEHPTEHADVLQELGAIGRAMANAAQVPLPPAKVVPS